MTPVVGIFAAFIVALVVAGVVGNVKRAGEMRELAAAKQWDQVRSDRRLPATFGGQPFQHGHNRVARNILRGAHNGRAVLLFDYTYQTRSGSTDGGDETHRHWVACVEALPAALPPLEVVHRNLFRGNVSRNLGGMEVPTGDPGFDGRYRVTTASPQLAADLLGPDLIRLLMSWPDFPWRIEGGRLLTWGKGTLTAHWIDPTLNMLTQLAEAVEKGTNPHI
jgi:hypothetical protein